MATTSRQHVEMRYRQFRARYNALAESHAELVAALTRFHIQHDKSMKGHFIQCGGGHKSLESEATQRCDQAQAALTHAKARALVPEARA